MTIAFPEIVIQELAEVASDIDGIDHVLLRPIRPTDPTGSFGFAGSEWAPRGDRMQIGHNAPPIGRYEIEVHILVRHSDEVLGRIELTNLANTFRQIVFSDASLHLNLGTHLYQLGNYKERFQRLGIDRIRYLSNEVTGTFLHLALIDLWVDTENC